MGGSLEDKLYKDGIPKPPINPSVLDLPLSDIALQSTKGFERYIPHILKKGIDARSIPVISGINPEDELKFFEEIWDKLPSPFNLRNAYATDQRFADFQISTGSKFFITPKVFSSEIELQDSATKHTLSFTNLIEGTFSFALNYQGYPEGFLSFFLAKTKSGKTALVCTQIQGFNRIILEQTFSGDQIIAENHLDLNSSPPGIKALSKMQDHGTPVSWRKILLEEFIQFAHDNGMSAYLLSAKRNPSVHPESYPLEVAMNHYDKTAIQCGMKELKSGFFVAPYKGRK